MTSRSSGTAGFGLRAGGLAAASGVAGGAGSPGATAAGGAASGFAGSFWQGAGATNAACMRSTIAAGRNTASSRPLTDIVSFTESPGRSGLQEHFLVLRVYPELDGLTIVLPAYDRHLLVDLARESFVRQRALIARRSAGR